MPATARPSRLPGHTDSAGAESAPVAGWSLLQGNAPLWRGQLECSRSLPGRTQRRFIDDQNPMIVR